MRLINIGCLMTFVYGLKAYHILVHSGFGSKSHATFMLELTEVLSQRGHHITFASTREKIHYSQGFNASVYELGSYPDYEHDLQAVNDEFILSPVLVDAQLPLAKFFAKAFEGFYETTFPTLDSFTFEFQPDLIMCDLAAPACQDVARKHQIPLIIGTQIPEVLGSINAPFLSEGMSRRSGTTDKLNWLEKFKDKIIEPILSISRFAPVIFKLNEMRAKFGADSFSGGLIKSDDVLVLADAFFGISPASPIPPNIEFIGPIISEKTAPLDKTTEKFLSDKHSIMYISFGSEIRMATFDFENILGAILIGLELGILDGIIWSLGKTKLEYLPKNISYKNQLFDTKKLLNSYNNKIILTNWAPQFAILNHKSTKLFLSHGGMGSVHETIASSKPMLCYPMAADQPRNSFKISDAGIGLRVDRYETSSPHILETIQTLLLDSQGYFQSNLARLRAISKLDSPSTLFRHKQFAADIIDTFIKTSHACRPILGPGCELEHRLQASRHLNFLQANNYDIWLPVCFFLLLSLATTLFSTMHLIRFLKNSLIRSYLRQSTKKID